MLTLQSVLDRTKNGQTIFDMVTKFGFKNPMLYKCITNSLCILVTFVDEPSNWHVEIQQLMLLQDEISIHLQCKTLIVNYADLPKDEKIHNSPYKIALPIDSSEKSRAVRKAFEDPATFSIGRFDVNLLFYYQLKPVGRQVTPPSTFVTEQYKTDKCHK